MKRFIRVSLLALLVMAASGCATTETNPSNVSMWDLTGGKKRLDEHLQNRQQELATLKDSTATLQQRLAVQEAKLDKVMADSKKSGSKPSAKNDKLFKEVSAKQIELNEAKSKLNKISENVRRYDERLSSGKIDNKNEAVLRVAEYQTDLEYQSEVVEKLERDIAKLNSKSQ